MKKAYKLNYDTGEFEEIQAVAGASTYKSNDSAIVICASCEEPMFFKGGFVSTEIRTSTGIGYCVCRNCKITEKERQKAYEARKKVKD